MSSASIHYDWPTVDVERIVENASNASAAKLEMVTEGETAAAAAEEAPNPFAGPAVAAVSKPDPPPGERAAENKERFLKQYYGDSMRRPSEEEEKQGTKSDNREEQNNPQTPQQKQQQQKQQVVLHSSQQQQRSNGGPRPQRRRSNESKRDERSAVGNKNGQQKVQQRGPKPQHQHQQPTNSPSDNSNELSYQEQKEQERKAYEEELYRQQNPNPKARPPTFLQVEEQRLKKEAEQQQQKNQLAQQQEERLRQQQRQRLPQEAGQQFAPMEQMDPDHWARPRSASSLVPLSPKQKRQAAPTPAPTPTQKAVHFDPSVRTPSPTASSHTRKTSNTSKMRSTNQLKPPGRQRAPPRSPPHQQQRSVPRQQQQRQKQQISPPQQQQQRPPQPRQRPPSPQTRQQRPPSPVQQQRRAPPPGYPQYSNTDDVYDVCIIGGGVVGLATLRAATLAGYKAVVIEAEADLLSGASSGNSGIACTGVDATPGTLERALIRDAISQLRPFLKTHRIPHRDCGSLVCQWDWDKISRGRRYESPLSKVLAESHDAGDSHARRMTGAEVGQWEPNVSPLCVGAVHIPGEVVVDSWLFAIALGAHARENGAKVYTHFEYDAAASWFEPQQGIWNVMRQRNKDHLIQRQPPASLRARAVVNATGIVADLVQGGTSDVRQPHWTSKPRRGQYRIFQANEHTHITHPIQPVPSQRTKGIFVYSSLYDHIVVGPTAEEQESRFDKRINSAVADDLTSFLLRIIPDLDPLKQHIGEYVGIRPATEHRDYQISLEAHRNWIVAAGIRSTGLTASLGIGRHMVHLLQSILPPAKPLASIRTTPLPEMRELVDHFNSNPDGNVLIHGYLYRVTHPLTKMGFHMRTGMASVGRKR